MSVEFVSPNCDLEKYFSPKCLLVGGQYCFWCVRLFMAANENSGELLGPQFGLNWAPEDLACPFCIGATRTTAVQWWPLALLSKLSLFFSMCLKSSECVKTWNAYFIARCGWSCDCWGGGIPMSRAPRDRRRMSCLATELLSYMGIPEGSEVLYPTANWPVLTSWVIIEQVPWDFQEVEWL